MADNNSKKYLTGEGLKYTLQQLKVKIDELYVSEQEVMDMLPAYKFGGDQLIRSYDGLTEERIEIDESLGLEEGKTYTIIYEGQAYNSAKPCNANGYLSFPDLGLIIMDDPDCHSIENMDGLSFSSFDLIYREEGGIKILDDTLLSDNVAMKSYVDEHIENLQFDTDFELAKLRSRINQTSDARITLFDCKLSENLYVAQDPDYSGDTIIFGTYGMVSEKQVDGLGANDKISGVFKYILDGQERTFSTVFNIYRTTDEIISSVFNVGDSNNDQVLFKMFIDQEFEFGNGFNLVDKQYACSCEIFFNRGMSVERILEVKNSMEVFLYLSSPNYLPLDGREEYTPSADYQPATKKYVDENKFSGDYNDLENKPVSIINFNTDFVDAVATHSEAYKVDTIAFSQSITVDDSHEYFVEAKYTDGAVVTKPLELAETSYRMYSKINAKAVVGSFDENVIDTNNQIGYVTSLIPIKYYNNKISICKKSNQSWYDFNLLVVDENLTITNIYTHDNLPTVDSLPSTAAYFAIYKYYTSSITDVDYLFSGDVTDGGLFIRIDSDIKYAGVCIFLEHSEEGNSILSNTEYTICEATSNYVLQNSDLGLYIADSMDVIYPAAYSETFVANDTGFASAMLIMNYSNISSIRVYTKNILVNAENKVLATKEYVDTAVTIDEDELDDMLTEVFGE